MTCLRWVDAKNLDKPFVKDLAAGRYQKVIKDVQKAIGVKVDGIAGPKTLTECKKYTIEKNDRGTLTAWVQKRLNTKGYKPGIADGIAGVNTMNAIKQFQRNLKLENYLRIEQQKELSFLS